MNTQQNQTRQTAAAVDKKSPAFAVSKYNLARSNFMMALILTVVNVLLGVVGASVYLLFSIAFPYFMFDATSLAWSIPSIVVFAAYVVFYILSKKRPAFMIVSLVFFSLDCLFLLLYSAYLSNIPELGVSLSNFIIDYLTHIWVLVYFIIGARYTNRYRAAIRENPSILEGSVFKNASIPVEPSPEEPAENSGINSFGSYYESTPENNAEPRPTDDTPHDPEQ